MELGKKVNDFINETAGVREIVHSGIFAIIFPGIQITSCAVLINGIVPKHFYEGVRIMALFVFYEVPHWEQDSPSGYGAADWKLFSR